MAKKADAPIEREEMDSDHKEPRVYELGFHIDPDLGTEEAKKLYQSVRAQIAGVGTVVAEGEPQKIPLAYTISRSETGGRHDFDASYFAWIAYETDGEGHDKVGEVARADKRIFRFLDIRTTKEEAQHAAEMHEMMLKAAEEKAAQEEAEEEVLEEELDQALKEVEA